MNHIPYFIAGWGVFRFITSHEKMNILIIFLGFLGFLSVIGGILKLIDRAENQQKHTPPNKEKPATQTKKYSQINEAINDLLTPECFIDLSNSQKQFVLDSLGNEDKLHKLNKLKEAIS